MLARLRQNPVRKALLARILPGVAGAVNASSFFTVGHYTSHATGNVSRIGDELAQGNYSLAVYSAVLVLSFLGGAIVAATCIELARRLARARYAFPLALEAASLMAVIFATLNGTLRQHPYWVGLICFAMGIQNGLVTRISGAVVRTTHLTGVTTDIGVELVRIFFWVRDQMRARTWNAKMGFFVQLHRDPELERLWLHLGIFGSFLAGAVVGPVCYLRWGERSLIIPVLVVLGLAVFDVMLGLDPLTAGNPQDSGPHQTSELPCSSTVP